MRIVTAALLVILGLHTARADDDAKKRVTAAKALLQKQVEAWSRGQGQDDTAEANKAFAATLAKDAVVSSRAGDHPSKRLFLGPPYNIGHLKITASQIGWSGSWGWIVAELHMTTRMYAEPMGAGDPNPQDEAVVYHWLELVVADGDGVKGTLVAIGEAKPDKRLSPLEAEKIPTIKNAPALLVAAADVANLPAKLAKDAETSVLGTGDTEVGFGAAAAKKLVTGWKGVSLEIVGKATTGDDDGTPVEITVGDAVVTWGHVRMKLPGHKELYELDVSAIARKTSSGLEIVALSYLPSN